MRRLIMIAVALGCAGSLLAGHEGHSQTKSCSDISVHFGDRDVVRATEELTIAGGPLDVEGDSNGGVTVFGTTTGSNYRVQVCKFADDAADLAGIKAVLSGRNLSVSGSGNNASAFLIIEAPAGSTMSVRTSNGPLSISGLTDTTLEAHAKNGPVGIKNSTGRITASSQNGPLTVSGSSGDFKLTSQNGPLSVKLDDEQWKGELEAASKNGPLTVSLPSNFRSGVLIESSGRSPVSCDCDNARRTIDDDDVQRIEFGDGPAVVRLSTVNGPLSVRTR